MNGTAGVAEHDAKLIMKITRRACLASAVAQLGWLRSTAGQQEEVPAQKQFDAFYTPGVRQAVERGLQYLVSRQNEDGSFGSGGYNRNVAVNSLCGMTMLASGGTPGRGPYGAHLSACVEFILENGQESGFLSVAEAASRGPMYGHGFATLFLAEVYGTSSNLDLKERLSKAVEVIVNSQNAEGGWRYEPRRDDADISVTVCQMMALRAARNAGIFVPNSTIDDGLEYVKRCQNEDGGFTYMAGTSGPSEFPRSAAALVAFYIAGVYEGDPVDRALAYMMRHPPRPNTLGRQSYFMYGHYYAVQAGWHAGGDYWKNWYPAIRGVLVEQQREEGEWFDVISLEYGTAMATLILQMPANYLPIFRR